MDSMKNTSNDVWQKQGMKLLILSITGLVLLSCSTKNGIPSINNLHAELDPARRQAILRERKEKKKHINPKSAVQPRPDALEDLDPDADDDSDTESDSVVQTSPKAEESTDQIKDVIMKEFEDWKGTPHRMGGESKNGIDCSGFAHHIYSSLFNLDVPRSSKAFMKAGQKISKDELKPGDLVIFHPRSYRHVGIYVGNNKFIHSSTSNGVAMSDLNNSYWKKCYRMARRIISE